MKMKSLALLICAALSSAVALAGNTTPDTAAREEASCSAIMVKMKAASGLTREQLPTLLNLSDTSLQVSAPFKHTTSRSAELKEFQALDAKYGFDRYLRITVPADKTRDAAWIKNLVSQLKENANVETAYPQSELTSLDKDVKAHTNTSVKDVFIPDYSRLQYYLKGPNETAANFTLGGVNRDSVNQYEGNDGSNVTILSHELGMWNQNHINLTKADFASGTPFTDSGATDHNTASVGIMAARNIGTADEGKGITGLAYNTHMAYAASGSDELYNIIPKLQAGDVVQIGFEVTPYPAPEQITGCSDNACKLPLEYMQEYFDVLKALTDKGVFVIEAAANGNINLDQSGFGGIFDLNSRDSGAILAGAIDPSNSSRAEFSNYGSRVTSASWGYNVATTGYGDLARPNADATYTSGFNGTSSANPIIAGAIASLSSIAKAHGKTVTPKQMREILHDTGTVLPGNTSSEIGTQPDMGRAVEEIMDLGGVINSNTAPVISIDQSTINTIGTDTAWNYPVIASSDQSDVTWLWEFLSGNDAIHLTNTDSDHNAIVVPPVSDDTQARFQVTATNSNGKSSTAEVAIIVIKPSVTIVGVQNTQTSKPEKLYPQANFEQATYAWRLLKDDQVVENGIDQNGQIKAGLPEGDYVAEVTATGTTQGTRTATNTFNVTITADLPEVNTDDPFVHSLDLRISTEDNGDSVTFENTVHSVVMPTSTPTYKWTLPSGAQGSDSGLVTQTFTFNKTNEEQTITVKVLVGAGVESNEIQRTVTVPAKTASENTDAAFINALKMAVNSTDNGNSVTFNGNVTSTSAATSTPTYSWTLPSGAQGSNSGTSSQSFTVNKTSEQQTLTVSATVGAGSESRVLTQTITVPALAASENTDAAFINALQMAVQSTDNGDSVTFNGNITSASAATSTPFYSWALPAGAQGSNSGTSSQSFTVNKTSQEQNLTVKVAVNAGTEARVLTQDITVPALTVAGAYPTWNADTAYTTGDKVSWNGGDYQAKWWTRGNEPGTSDAWESLNANQVSEWNSSMAYNGGDIVLFNGHTWKAKWWTKGNQPGTNDVWEQIS